MSISKIASHGAATSGFEVERIGLGVKARAINNLDGDVGANDLALVTVDILNDDGRHQFRVRRVDRRDQLAGDEFEIAIVLRDLADRFNLIAAGDAIDEDRPGFTSDESAPIAARRRSSTLV